MKYKKQADANRILQKRACLIMKFAFLTFFVFSVTSACSQRDYGNYPFINADIDSISSDSTALKSFFVKLQEMKEGKRKNVVIVHIGDSHLQADFFSGWVRQKLQEKYGNGGRGLIFPYKVAGSNEPVNYYSSSSGTWKGRRCVMMKPSDIPIGIAGFGLRTYDSSATLKVSVKNGDSLNYGFTDIRFIHDKGPHCYDWVVYTSKDLKDSVVIRDTASNYGTAIDNITLKDTMRSCTLCIRQSDTSQSEAMVYGIVLGNDQPGIIYNTIGSNGARYEDYNNSEYFYQQLSELHPDLVILSLGTNEAYSKRFNSGHFENEMDTMIAMIRKVAPGTDFLLTSPNDAYRNNRYKNVDIEDAVASIRKVAKRDDAAFWDFYHIMGGYGSIASWYKYHLCQKGKVHLTVKGYTVQGELFYDAFQKAVNDTLHKSRE